MIKVIDMKQILWLLVLAEVTSAEQEKLVLSLVFVGVGLLWIGISIPLLYEKIGPNQWYGFRTRKTLSDKEIWYKANKYMGKDFVILGSIQILYNLILIVLPTNILPFLCAGNMLILVGGVAIILIRSLLYLRKL